MVSPDVLQVTHREDFASRLFARSRNTSILLLSMHRGWALHCPGFAGSMQAASLTRREVHAGQVHCLHPSAGPPRDQGEVTDLWEQQHKI